MQKKDFVARAESKQNGAVGEGKFNEKTKKPQRTGMKGNEARLLATSDQMADTWVFGLGGDWRFYSRALSLPENKALQK